jgi:hypothetical protein
MIVDEMGKNISGAGMDPDIIGRICVQKCPAMPKIRRLFVRDLTPESGGNVVGIGMADFVTRRFVEKIDWASTRMNAITSGVPEAIRLPIAFPNDREAIETALGMIGLVPPERARVVRIKNTLHVQEMYVSESLLTEVRGNARISANGALAPMAFDAAGNLLPF